MPDLNSDALGIWEHLKPAIDKEIEQKTRGMVQRRKMKVTTAPSISTGTIGVTEAFGTTEMVIPFATNLISATVGDMVWVEFMYGATNAFASMFASADEKDWDVAGDLSVGGNAGISGNLDVSGSTSLQNTTVNGVLDVTQRRAEATLTSSGWYRVLRNIATPTAVTSFEINLVITRSYYYADNEVHKITLLATYFNFKFVNEQSVSNTLGIDKIRYMRENNGYGYIDIHYSLENENYVTVDYTVNVRTSYKYAFQTRSLQSVAPSPSDETEMALYTFSANATPLRYTETTTPVLVTDYGTPKFTVNAPYYDLGNIGIVVFNPSASVLQGQSFSSLLQIENLPFVAISANGFVRSLGVDQDGLDAWQLSGTKMYLRQRGGFNLLGTFGANPILQVTIIGIK